MANRPPRIPITVSGLGAVDGSRLMEKIADELGLSLVFQSGSNPTVIIQIGSAMEEQRTQHLSTVVGNVSDSTIGAIGSARDVSVWTHRLDGAALPDDAKEALREAMRRLGELDLSSGLKGDVEEDLGKIADELQKSQPDEGRLKRLLRGIKDVAAPVASALSIAASLAKLLN